MADLEGVQWVPWNPSFEGLHSFSVADPDGFRGFHGTVPFQGEPKNVFVYTQGRKASCMFEM